MSVRASRNSRGAKILSSYHAAEVTAGDSIGRWRQRLVFPARVAGPTATSVWQERILQTRTDTVGQFLA